MRWNGKPRGGEGAEKPADRARPQSLGESRAPKSGSGSAMGGKGGPGAVMQSPGMDVVETALDLVTGGGAGLASAEETPKGESDAPAASSKPTSRDVKEAEQRGGTASTSFSKPKNSVHHCRKSKEVEVKEEKKAEAAKASKLVDESRANRIKQGLTCILCGELFKEATTITECLHTFCRPCIDSRIRIGARNNKCPHPGCGVTLLPDPYDKKQIIFDCMLNDIVTKLFPREGDNTRAKLREERSLHEQAAKAMAATVRTGKRGRPPKVEPQVSPTGPGEAPPKKRGRPPKPKPQGTETTGTTVVEPAHPPANPMATAKQALTGDCKVSPKSAGEGQQEQQQQQQHNNKKSPLPSPGEVRGVLKVRIERHEDSQYPELKKMFFKVYPNVKVKTLTRHLTKRLSSSLGGDIPGSEHLRLLLPQPNVTQNPMLKGFLPLDITVEEIQNGLEEADMQLGDENCIFSLQYKETPEGGGDAPGGEDKNGDGNGEGDQGTKSFAWPSRPNVTTT